MLLADIFERFIGTWYKEDRINPLCFSSLPCQTWDAGLEHTKTDLKKVQEAEIFWFLRFLL